ncbi:MAG: hypothetical protein A3B86_03955 [Candidatus Yanofskybacteria bacterium RIFCSPHIGHO2_02_FULL_38_22b]|uniref:EfeO-type cupredoxin-like domain-containing protein n=1 Tax=Candidatus Yanofskybacteria bacterium RIFCSPHIGHO2_02_FULL_38_22b TaxID=1802673 RepID=A0A1F8EZF8_9BACT|nr:MAG: hypothetical protein A2816_01725 [Candidatus Yanofskybacteria bacterium RIFCSPHIGHO2_01_FULL_39_44]OGN06245.1 MAG: hypothetical protein A3B86_03955 [Candidatus Yanofskybacteria bacterium RIFCSPHIGHO2_02_FULL_38_22b]OGN19665.1 MAG: hypothetical protein A2910_03690 [Candidatus Yanofskybacteria bacterium RIFCSPLOWO2_01_FULL_39_28]
MYKKQITLGLLIALCSGLVFVFARGALINREYPVQYIVFKDSGFYPKEIYIKRGTKVVFSSERGDFWPASVPHPSHTVYPEFDPKRLVGGEESWSFVFDRIGTWLYHDHIKHEYAGKIIVVDNLDANSVTASVKDNCLSVPKDQKLSCWDRQLETVLVSAGLDAAFEAFKVLYNTESEVPKSCHEWGHILGKAAYDLYKNKEEISFKKEMGFCGYGFFHSFLEKLIQDTGDFASARRWCVSLTDKITDPVIRPSVWRNCVHGVGHGTTALLLEDQRNWNNFQKVADTGLGVCEKTFEDKDLRDCYDGVFNELYLEVLNSNYGFNFQEFREKDDPFWYCRPQEDRHRESCYFEFVGIFYILFDLDVSRAMQYAIKNVDDLDVRGPSVVAKLAADFIQFDIVNSEHSCNVKACRDIPKNLFDVCFGGIVNGFIQHGEPENFHIRGISFCEEKYLSSQEKYLCYFKLFGQLSANYSPEKMKEVCNSIETEEKSICLSAIINSRL